jgi:hypothetical protein
VDTIPAWHRNVPLICVLYARRDDDGFEVGHG